MSFFSSFIRRVLDKRVSGFFKSTGIWSEKGDLNSINNSSCPLLMVSPPPPLFGESKFHNVSSGKDLILEKKTKKTRPRPSRRGELELAGSSHGWLALYNRRNDDDVFLWNPITSQHIMLPPLHTLPDPEVNSGGGVSRVALSSSWPDHDDCRAVITVGRARRLAFCAPGGSTGWTQIGEHYCERWNCYGARRETAPKEYEDVVYSSRHKLFFCITRVGSELEAWNLQEPRSPTIDWRLTHDEDEQLMFDFPSYDWPSKCDPEELLACWHLKYLVLVSDELFLVVRHVCPRMCHGFFEEPAYYSKYRGSDYSHPYKTIDFDVYKIDRQLGKLRHVEGSLDGAALFVGMNHSYAAASATELGLEPDSIYFADEKRLMRLSQSDVHNEYGGHDNGIFNYQTKTFSSCSCSCAHHCPLNSSRNIKRIDPPPIWFTLPPIS